MLGIGALVGGALGFYIQDRFMESYRKTQGEFIEEEARKRFDAMRRGHGTQQTRADIVKQSGTQVPPAPEG